MENIGIKTETIPEKDFPLLPILTHNINTSSVGKRASAHYLSADHSPPRFFIEAFL
jgi:hypothetical protein